MDCKQKQIDKFKEAAREAEADMDEKSFDKALGELAKPEAPKAPLKSSEKPPSEK